MGTIGFLPAILRALSSLISPRFATIIFTTLLCAARLFEFTARVYTSREMALLTRRKSSWTVSTFSPFAFRDVPKQCVPADVLAAAISLCNWPDVTLH
jgi:hypothetical protein